MAPCQKAKKQKTGHHGDERGPVVSMDLEDQKAPLLNLSSRHLLETMIHPVSKDIFLKEFFRKKALHVSGNSERIAGIMDAMEGLDPETLLKETSSDNVFVWIKQEDGKIESIEISDPRQALILYKAGHSTYCRAPPSVEQPMVANMLLGTGFGCGQYDPTETSSVSLGRGEVEVFMGTQGHCTDWHYDFQENFTLQLSGSKRWTLQQSPVKCPSRGCTPHYNSPDAVEAQLKAVHLGCPDFRFGPPGVHDRKNALGDPQWILMKAGDMLYFPAGMWHRVETVEPGVSINVSLMATNYATITCQALQHLLLSQQDSQWRETIMAGPTSNGVDALQHLQNLLQELPAIIARFANHQGGARAILPPALLTPPKFESMPGEEIILHDEKMEASNNQQDEEEDANNNDGEEETNNDEEIDDDDPSEHLDDVLGASIVNASEFEPPEGWTPEPAKPDLTLVQNPLAWIRPVNHVTKFYKPGDDYENLYYLNVNYAGNEMHESAVRVVIRDNHPPTDINKEEAQSLSPRVKCYLFYGLFCWGKEN